MALALDRQSEVNTANRLVLTAIIIAALFALALLIPATIANTDHQISQPVDNDNPSANAFPEQTVTDITLNPPDPVSETQISDQTEAGTNITVLSDQPMLKAPSVRKCVRS